LPALKRPTRRGLSGGKSLLVAALVVLGVAGITVVAVPGLSKPLSGLLSSKAVEIVAYEVKPASLPVTVVERGSLESANNEDVYCEVEGTTTIISIVPEGTRVKKGQLVCELDSAALKDTLTNQVISTEGAKAAYQNAKLTRQVAEIAVTEYVEGVFKQELETVKGEIALAESERKRAEDRLEWSNRMYGKGYVSLAQNIADKVGLQQKIFVFEQAQTKLNVLLKYTKEKTIKELESDVEKARSDELAKEQTWDLEKKKQAKLERQIKNCQLFAPNDGLVVYANDPNRFGGSSTPQIEEGAQVRERQKIFSLPDIAQMRVNVKVHESMVDRITAGLRSRIRVDAFADQVLTGTVTDVAPLPDPTSFFSSDVKVYTTHVAIDKGIAGLRPGMTAQVEILVANLDNVLSVPVQAVLEYKGKDHIAALTPEGYKFRDVVLGTTNDKHIEVREGLKAGDRVALNPIALMTEDEKREAFGSSGKDGDAAKKDWGAAPKGKAGGPPVAPGAGPAAAGEPDGKAKAKAKGKGAGKGQRGGGFMSKMDPAAREKFRSASPEEQRKMLEQQNVPPEMVDRILERMKNGGGFGGGGGGGGGGRGFGGGGGGGFGGGGGRGGPDQ
jgi:HlyD family secretion protein